MGQASQVQEENKWDLEETIRQAEQKFATDLRTIAKETTNDENKSQKNTKLTKNNYQRDSVWYLMTTDLSFQNLSEQPSYCYYTKDMRP